MKPGWYENFFHGLALDLWRHVVSPEQTAPAGARLLDVPCGNGRHALELAARGYRVTGVDLSSESLAEARRLGAAAGAGIEWRLSDMRQLPWTAEFDGAFCFGNSFGYLEPEGMPELERRTWCRAGDVWMLIENEYDAAHSCLDTTYTFLREGRVETGESTHWVYTAAGIQGLLAQSGLETRALYGGLQREPYRLGAPVLYLVAERSPQPI